MNIHDLTVNQLKRAAAIKERLASLNQELSSILGVPNRSRPETKKRRTMSAAAKRKIAAAQRARWTSLRRVKTAKRSVKLAGKKKTMTAAARAQLSAKLKRYWAAKKAGKK
jgi:hypothetical protein